MPAIYSPSFRAIVQSPGATLYRLLNVGNLLTLTDALAAIEWGGRRYLPGLIGELTSRTVKSGDAIPQYEATIHYSKACSTEQLMGLTRSKSRFDVAMLAVDPSGTQVVETLYRGYVGSIKVEDGIVATVEVLSLAHQADGEFGWTLSPSCNHILGDSLCRAPYWLYGVTGSILSIQSNRSVFTMSGQPNPLWLPQIAQYRVGKVQFLNRLNSHFAVQDIQYVGGNTQVFLGYPLYEPLRVGETVTLLPDCDKSAAHCNAYQNIARFTGFTQMPLQAQRLSGV
jgi:hypothetical protein